MLYLQTDRFPFKDLGQLECERLPLRLLQCSLEVAVTLPSRRRLATEIFRISDGNIFLPLMGKPIVSVLFKCYILSD